MFAFFNGHSGPVGSVLSAPDKDQKGCLGRRVVERQGSSYSVAKRIKSVLAHFFLTVLSYLFKSTDKKLEVTQTLEKEKAPLEQPIKEKLKELCAKEFFSQNDPQPTWVQEIVQFKVGLNCEDLKGTYKALQALLNKKGFVQSIHSVQKGDPAYPAVEFLLELTQILRSTNIEKELIEHARSKINPSIQPISEKRYSLAQTAEAINRFNQECPYKRNNRVQSLFWAKDNPEHAHHSIHSNFYPEHYDSTRSNPTYVIQKMNYRTAKGQSIDTHLVAGPTPFNDPVYKHLFLKRAKELRFNVMDRGKANEKVMIHKMDQVADQSEGHLTHVVLGFKKGKYAKPKTVDALIDGYKEHLIENHGSKGKNHLEDRQIKLACESAKSFVKQLNPDLSQKDTRHAILVIVDTMMALGMVINELENSTSTDPHFISVACKQCFDRGPVYMIALMIFLRSLDQGNLLTEEEFLHISGFPMIRAPLNEKRAQINRKFQVYQAFAHLIGTNTELLHEITTRFKNDLLTSRSSSPSLLSSTDSDRHSSSGSQSD